MFNTKVTFTFEVSYDKKDSIKKLGCWWTGRRWIKKFNAGDDSLKLEIYNNKRLFYSFKVKNIEGLSIDEAEKNDLLFFINDMNERHQNYINNLWSETCKHIDEQYKLISKEDIEENPELLDEEYDEYIKDVRAL
jgi:hypothetical protein